MRKGIARSCRWLARPLLLGLFLVLGLGLGLSVPWLSPLAAADKKESPKLATVEIDSESVDYFIDKRYAVFTGNVEATDGQMELTADKMVVKFTAQNEVKALDATGNVVVTHEGTVGKSGKAAYDVALGVLTLFEQPVMEQGNNRIVGAEELILRRNEGKFHSRGGRPRLEVRKTEGEDEDVNASALNIFQDPEKKSPGPAAPTEVISDVLIYNIDGRAALFLGNVLIRDDAVAVAAEKVEVLFTGENKIRSLRAEGEVVIDQDNKTATAGHADYDLENGRIVLTQDPELTEPGRVLKGATKLIYHRAAAKFTAVGPTKVVFTTIPTDAPKTPDAADATTTPNATDAPTTPNATPGATDTPTTPATATPTTEEPKTP